MPTVKEQFVGHLAAEIPKLDTLQEHLLATKDLDDIRAELREWKARVRAIFEQYLPRAAQRFDEVHNFDEPGMDGQWLVGGIYDYRDYFRQLNEQLPLLNVIGEYPAQTRDAIATIDRCVEQLQDAVARGGNDGQALWDNLRRWKDRTYKALELHVGEDEAAEVYRDEDSFDDQTLGALKWLLNIKEEMQKYPDAFPATRHTGRPVPAAPSSPSRVAEPTSPTHGVTDSPNSQRPAVAAETTQRPVVVSVHGIRTRGAWQKELVPCLNGADFDVYPLDYGFFWAISLLLPFMRRRKIDWFREEYLRARGTYRECHIIAHSFGTYIVARALEIYPELHCDQLILCGSIVRRDYPWGHFKAARQVRRVLNDYGRLDIWSRLVEWVVSDAGASGRIGFDPGTPHDVLVQREHSEFRHSDYFYEGNYKQNWIPFLRGVDPPATLPPPPRRGNPRYIATVTFFIIAILALVIWGPRLIDKLTTTTTGSDLTTTETGAGTAIASTTDADTTLTTPTDTTLTTPTDTTITTPTDTTITTPTDTTTIPLPRRTRLAELDVRIEAIRQHLDDLDLLSAGFYGPINQAALTRYRNQKTRAAESSEARRPECAAYARDIDLDQCVALALRQFPAPAALPPPGRIFKVTDDPNETGLMIKLDEAVFRDIVDARSSYTAPLTIVVKGRWGGDPSDGCADVIAAAVEFQSRGRTFGLWLDDGRREAAEIIGQPLRARTAAAVVIEGWPAHTPLSARNHGALTYGTKSTLCSTNRPEVLIWQQDDRFNSANPYDVMNR